MSVFPTQVWFSFFNNSGSNDLNVDGSSTPVHFDVEGDESCGLYRVTASLVNSGLRPTRFGGLTELVNGITIKLVDSVGATILDFLDGVSIKKDADWTFLTGVDGIIIASAGDDHLSIRWTISKGIGDILRLTTGEKIRITVNDNLTSITEFRAFAQGVT